MSIRTLNGEMGWIRSLNGKNPLIALLKEKLKEGEAIDITHDTSSGENTFNVAFKSNTAVATTLNDTDLVLISDAGTPEALKYITIANFKMAGTLWHLDGVSLYPDSTSYNLLIGTATGTGHKFLCSGTAKITGGATLESTLNVSDITTLTTLICNNTATFNKQATFEFPVVMNSTLNVGDTTTLSSLICNNTATFNRLATFEYPIVGNSTLNIGDTTTLTTLICNNTATFNKQATFEFPVVMNSTLNVSDITTLTNATITGSLTCNSIINKGVWQYTASAGANPAYIKPDSTTTAVIIGSTGISTGALLTVEGDFSCNEGSVRKGLTLENTVTGADPETGGFIMFMPYHSEAQDNFITLTTASTITSDTTITLPNTTGTVALTSQVPDDLWDLTTGTLTPKTSSNNLTLTSGNLDVGGTTLFKSDVTMRGANLIIENDYDIRWGTASDEQYIVEWDTNVYSNVLHHWVNDATGDLVNIYTADGGGVSGDSWKVAQTTDHKYSIGNDKTGSFVEHFQIEANSTILNSKTICRGEIEVYSNSKLKGNVYYGSDGSWYNVKNSNGLYFVNTSQGYWDEAFIVEQPSTTPTEQRATLRLRTIDNQPAEFFFDVSNRGQWDVSCRNDVNVNEWCPLHWYGANGGVGTYGYDMWASSPEGGSHLKMNLEKDGTLETLGAVNPFTGSHNIKIENDITYEKGMIVKVISSTVRTYPYKGEIVYDVGNNHFICEICDIPSCKSVIGVISRKTKPYFGNPVATEYEPNTFMYNWSVNAVGEGSILITNINGEIEMGDLIVSSEIAGYGMLQKTARGKDDIIRSKSVAKCLSVINWANITDTITYNGTSYKKFLCPCIYMCG